MLPDREVLANLERCFGEGEIETLTRGGSSLAVKVIHKPTGIESASESHGTQGRNKIQALLDLTSLLMALPSSLERD